MTIYKTFSKLQIAKIFSVSRGCIYDWEARGCPSRPPERPGRPAKLDFEAVLEWRLNDLDAQGYTEAGLELVEKMARERLEKIHG